MVPCMKGITNSWHLRSKVSFNLLLLYSFPSIKNTGGRAFELFSGAGLLTCAWALLSIHLIKTTRIYHNTIFNLILLILISLSLLQYNDQWHYDASPWLYISIVLSKIGCFSCCQNWKRKLLFILWPFFSNKWSIYAWMVQTGRHSFLLSCGLFIMAFIIYIAVKLLIIFITIEGFILLMNEQIKWKSCPPGKAGIGH